MRFVDVTQGQCVKSMRREMRLVDVTQGQYVKSMRRKMRLVDVTQGQYVKSMEERNETCGCHPRLVCQVYGGEK